MSKKIKISFEHTTQGEGVKLYVVTVSHEVYLSTNCMFEARGAFELAKKHKLNATLHEVNTEVMENYNGSYDGSDYNEHHYYDEE